MPASSVQEFAPLAPEVNEIFPGRGNEDEAHRLKGQFGDAYDFKQPFAKDWPRWYLLYSGRHWDGRQPEWMATPVVNLTFSVIQTILPILTDSRPQISVIARKPEDEKVGQVLRQIVEWLWEHNDMDVLLPKVMLNTLIFGNGFTKVLWDQSLRGGLGDIRVVAVDPARTIEEADYVIHAENLQWSQVKRMFPELSKDTKGGPDEPKLTLDRTVTNQGGRGYTNETVRSTDGSTAFTYNRSSEESSRGSEDRLVTVYERWERKEDGSVWQTVVANDQVLVHKPSPFGNGRFPFVHFVDHPATWSVWAMGEVQQVERLQIEINRRRGHILDILRYTANPMLVVDPVSGIEYQSLQARPGLVVPAEGGPNSVAWLQPPAIPNALFQINEIDKQDFDIVLGNVDVLQGRRPEGIEAGIAIEMLQEAANVRMRLKVRHMEAGIRRLGELLISMVQEFYTTERVFAIAGNDAAMAEKPITKDAVQFLSINQPTGMTEGPEGPVPQLANAIPAQSDAEFDVRVGPGSTLPVSRFHEFQKAITLFSMGILDDEGVMKRSGFQRWDEELARSRAWKAQQMQVQAMAQAQAAPQEEAMPTDEEMESGMAEGASVPPPEM